MSEIKPRSGWSDWSEPVCYAYLGPKPMPTITKTIDREICACDESEISLASIELPEGATIKDIVIQVREYRGDIACDIIYRRLKKIANPRYKAQLKQYEKDAKAYEKAIAEHKLEVVAWKEWKKQEEEKQVKRDLDAAEKLLKKHGRTIK